MISDYAISKRGSALPKLKRRAVTAGLIGWGLSLTACTPGSDLPPLPALPPGPYRIGIDEEVRVIVFGADHLTGQFRVNDRGNIAIPLLGNVHADGLTTNQLEVSIARQLKDQKVLLTPSVAVEILSYRPIFILGEVTKPGQYPYQPGMTVLTAVSIAGGFTYRAQEDHASILRTINGRSFEGRVNRTTAVEPGDVIDILPRYF